MEGLVREGFLAEQTKEFFLFSMDIPESDPLSLSFHSIVRAIGSEIPTQNGEPMRVFIGKYCTFRGKACLAPINELFLRLGETFFLIEGRGTGII